MTAARCLVVLVSLVTVSLSAPASADLLARNFPAYGERVQFPPGGAGFVDTADPDNTCLALLTSTVTTDAVVAFYYNFGRTLVVGTEVDENAGVNVLLGGTPVDDCFNTASGGLISSANPGNDLVADQVVVGAGGGVNSFNVLGSSEVAALTTVAYTYRVCGGADWATLGTANTAAPLSATEVVGCSAAFSAFPADRTTPGWTTGIGFLDRNNFAFLHRVMDTADDHAVVEFCVSADLFDTATGNTTAASDRDHVLALTTAGISTVATAAFLSNLNNQPGLAMTECGSGSSSNNPCKLTDHLCDTLPPCSELYISGDVFSSPCPAIMRCEGIGFGTRWLIKGVVDGVEGTHVDGRLYCGGSLRINTDGDAPDTTLGEPCLILVAGKDSCSAVGTTGHSGSAACRGVIENPGAVHYFIQCIHP